MLEWYRVGWTLEPLMDETVALVQALWMNGREATVSRVSFRDLYRQQLRASIRMTADLETVRNAAAGIAIDGDGLTRDNWLDLLMTHQLQPTFGRDEIRVVHDYPASQCALAKVVERDGVPVAERFELYLGPLEWANGYHELTDAAEQRVRFNATWQHASPCGARTRPRHRRRAARRAGARRAGLRRRARRGPVLMAMLDTPRIADVVAFDFARC